VGNVGLSESPDNLSGGITNDGKIIGTASGLNFSTKDFLYKNGAFKVIPIPHADPSLAALMSISPKQGLILGVTDQRHTGTPGFIAQCQ
jgi:probable HAF family extracellular repeat protein